MKSKKYFVAMAIFGSVLFTASAAIQLSLDSEKTTKIEKKKRKIPKWG